ncbi:MAG: peptidoglycan DD-metalloendopeptidase family protein [Alphaproteobacteria bacterium]|nr:peptidoglycan DD-metalloendopeptidase family protein [Alphaproteobacteria bacterium]
MRTALLLTALTACTAPEAAHAPAGPPEPPPASAATPDRTCALVRTPFLDDDRRSYAVFKGRLRSGFGDYRGSYVEGHKHAGVDLETTFAEPVHPICTGRVVDIHLGSPHRTIVLGHVTPEGERFWSSYKHVEDIQVARGDWVDPDTPLARVFDDAEQKAAPWALNHLHFEMRRSVADNGAASWTSMTMEELERYAFDPDAFFEARLEP